jgi:DNA-binding NarL/FixJ family response regulator
MVNFQENLILKAVIADDHEVVRAGLKRLLSIDKRIITLDEASNGEEAVKLVEYHKPDILLIDIMMPKMNGIDAVDKLKKSGNETKMIMLTAFEDSLHIEKALDAGADGYLSKDIGAKDLIDALFKVVTGQRVFSKSIIRVLQNKYIPYIDNEEQMVSISPREQEILNLIALGKTSQQISEELFISVRTVQAHRSNIMQKLGIKNAAGLIRYAVMNFGESKQIDKKI